MAMNTKVEWPDATFNPWIGCQKVSAGCKNCYAERDFARKPRWASTWGPPETSERIRTSEANWRKPLAWNRQAKAEGRRIKVFCASLADVFEDNPALVDWRPDLLDLIEVTPNLDWLLLTKRPENVKRMTRLWSHYDGAWPGNVWLGVSVENQEMANKRVPLLLQIQAVIRFVSCEPLLGPIDLCVGDPRLEGPQWIIVGGESGSDARPMHPDWARSLRDQAVSAGVPFFFKQWGEFRPADFGWKLPDGQQKNEMVRVGRKRAGNLLDGKVWQQFPEVDENVTRR